ncbi:MAG: hypothetical protein DHS20C10_13510 [marine bacterium B5-7]|nr:MAG: hypothetical protein DHS20C10_13510 [marine bacterium B5-7]
MNFQKPLRLSNYVDQLQRTGHYWFLRHVAKEALNVSDSSLSQALSRLVKRHRICRVRGDFFVIVPSEYQTAGCIPAEWFMPAFMQHINQAYYVSLLTAASFSGAAHQQVMDFQIITNGIVRPMMIGNQRITCHYKKMIPSEFLMQLKTPTSCFNVSKPELTAFDLVYYINASGQINAVATVLSELIETLDSQLLEKIARSDYITLSTIQRLGYVLDTIGATLDLHGLEKIIKEKKPKFIPLINSKTKPIISRSQRWHILINETIEIDDL